MRIHKHTVTNVVDLLLTHHEAAKDRHNYFLVAANLIKAEFLGESTMSSDSPNIPSEKRTHVTNGGKCWCDPVIAYKDPISGAEVLVHKEEPLK